MSNLLEFDYECKLPYWCESFDESKVAKIREMHPEAFKKTMSLGVEHWNSIVVSVGNRLRNLGFDEEEVRYIFTETAWGYRDEVEDRDIERAVNAVFNLQGDTSRKRNHPTKSDPITRHVIDAAPFQSVTELKENSVCDTQEPLEILKSMYEPDEFVTLDKDRDRGVTLQRKNWETQGVDEMNFIVPSNMLSSEGEKADGGMSPRGIHNVAGRKYFVIEHDDENISLDQKAAIASFFAQFMPIRLILYTGNKSIHTWVECQGQSEETLLRVFNYAVLTGADKSLWTLNQYARFPGGVHYKTGKKHVVLSFHKSHETMQEWDEKGLEEAISTIHQKERSKRFELIPVDQIEVSKKRLDFVKDLLTEGGLSTVYAPPGVGKSFWVLDLAISVATGAMWRGEKRVWSGPVVYFCLEGQGDFRNRIAALKRAGKIPPETPFYLVETPLDLRKEEDLEQIIASIEEVTTPPKMIVIDTLSRTMAGGNENGPEEMTLACKGAGILQAKFGSHVCLVHHPGKDVSKGPRGHTALYGAVDTLVEIVKDANKGICTVTTVKQKAMPDGKKFPFKLNATFLGHDDEGDEITTCLVEHLPESEAPARTVGASPKWSDEDLLELLPQKNKSSWQAKASEELGMSKSSFYTYMGKLQDGVDYDIRKNGSIERIEASELM